MEDCNGKIIDISWDTRSKLYCAIQIECIDGFEVQMIIQNADDKLKNFMYNLSKILELKIINTKSIENKIVRLKFHKNVRGICPSHIGHPIKNIWLNENCDIVRD